MGFITSLVDIAGARWHTAWRKAAALAIKVRNVTALLSLMKFSRTLWLVFLIKIDSKVNFVGSIYDFFFPQSSSRFFVLTDVSTKHLSQVPQEGWMSAPRVCHWWFVTRQSWMWKRSCSNLQPWGTSVLHTANMWRRLQGIHRPAPVFTEHTMGNFHAKSQNKRLLSTRHVTKIIYPG